MTAPDTHRSRRRALGSRWAALAFIASALGQSGSAVAEDPQALPLAARQALVKQQVVDALTAGRFLDLYAGMDAYRALQSEGVQIPSGLLFAEADAARSQGNGVRAKRAYNEYFKVANRDDPTYKEALRGYAALSDRIPESLKPMLDDMVLVTGGDFRMGNLSVAGATAEQPAHDVRVPPFAIGAHEVTRGDFLIFMTATNYTMTPSQGEGQEFCDLKEVDWQKTGFSQDDRHPVVCVSWDDARAYVEWLNARTGLKFRLPSEAEWEYAARARSETAYWWGNDFDAAKANGAGASPEDAKATGTTPVGRYPVNPVGLYDMNGNAAEWVADCWNDSYESAPADGSAWLTGTCDAHPVRGGGWVHFPEQLTSSYRLRLDAGYRTTYVGFRLAM